MQFWHFQIKYWDFGQIECDFGQIEFSLKRLKSQVYLKFISNYLGLVAYTMLSLQFLLFKLALLSFGKNHF